MERKTLVGILLLISGVVVSVVSIWMLADNVKIAGVSIGAPDSAKVGMACGVFTVAVAIACFVLKNLEDVKYIMLGVILILLIFAIATFGMALKDRLDIKKVENAVALQYGRRSEISVPLDPFGVLTKLKNQSIALIVVGTIAIVLEITSMILVFKLQPSRNAMPMDKPY